MKFYKIKKKFFVKPSLNFKVNSMKHKIVLR